MTDKRQKAIKVTCKPGGNLDESTTKRSMLYSWNIFLFRENIWVLLELVCNRTQNFTIIDQEKHEVKKFTYGTLRLPGFSV